MIPNSKKPGLDGSANPEQERSWSDLEALARRVIRAANMAVLAHAEMDVFTPTHPVPPQAEKKAG